MITRDSLKSIKWPIKPLGDVVEFLDNLRKPVTGSVRKAGPYPYYGANGVQGNINEYIFDEPLILLAEDGGHFGSAERDIAYRISGKCWVNNHAHVLRARPFMDVDFLCRHLERYDVTPFINGSTRQKLNKGEAERIPIAVPPLAEQRRIAAILDKADGIRRKRQEALKLADEFLRSVFLDMFGDPVTNPKGWPILQLHEIADIASGVTKGKNYEGKNTVLVPYMRVASVQDGYLRLDDITNIEVTPDDVERYRLVVGDLLLTEGGDPDKLGRGAIWKADLKDCIHQNHIFRVRADLTQVLPDFLSALVGSSRGKAYFLRAAKQTTGIASINMTQLRAFPALVPPVRVQAKFVKVIEQFSKTERTLENQQKLDSDLFNALVQRAFRGEL